MGSIPVRVTFYFCLSINVGSILPEFGRNRQIIEKFDWQNVLICRFPQTYTQSSQLGLQLLDNSPNGTVLAIKLFHQFLTTNLQFGPIILLSAESSPKRQFSKMKALKRFQHFGLCKYLLNFLHGYQSYSNPMHVETVHFEKRKSSCITCQK